MIVGLPRLFIFLGLLVGAYSAFASYVPFSFGLWADSQPIALAFLVAGLLCSLGLALMPERTSDLLRQKGVLSLFALGALSFLFMPFADYPLLSMMGAPQTFQGGFLWIVLGLLAAGAMALRDDRRFSIAFCAVAGGGLALLTLLQSSLSTAIYGYEQTRFLNDWLAFYALAWPFILYGWLGPHGLWRWPAWTAAAGLSLLTLWVAQNNTAWLMLAFAALAWVARPFLAAQLASSRSAFLFGVAAFFLPFAWIGVIQIFHDAGPASLQSRALLQGLLWQSFLSEPWRLATGHGWGHGIMLLQSHWHYSIGRAPEGWDILTRDYVSSHNLGFDVLLALGIPGVVAFLLIGGFLLSAMRPQARFAGFLFLALYGCLQGMWFELPGSLTFAALAMGGLLDRGAVVVSLWPGFAAKPARWTLASLLTLVLGWMAIDGISFSNAKHRAGKVCADIPRDSWRGDIALARLVRQTALENIRDGQMILETEARAEKMRGVLCALENSISDRSSPYALATALVVRTHLAHSRVPMPFEAWRRGVMQQWHDRLFMALRAMPERQDLTLPFFAHLDEIGDQRAQAQLISALRYFFPQSPVPYWLEGLELMASPDLNDVKIGLDLIRLSLSYGIEDYVVIPHDLVAQIRGQ